MLSALFFLKQGGFSNNTVPFHGSIPFSFSPSSGRKEWTKKSDSCIIFAEIEEETRYFIENQKKAVGGSRAACMSLFYPAARIHERALERIF